MCVGSRLHMPEPDPVHGPQPLDQLDVRIGTMRWLRRFPDSRRRLGTPEAAEHPAEAPNVADGSVAAAISGEAVSQEAMARAAFNFYAARAHMKGRTRKVW